MTVCVRYPTNEEILDIPEIKNHFEELIREVIENEANGTRQEKECVVYLRVSHDAEHGEYFLGDDAEGGEYTDCEPGPCVVDFCWEDLYDESDPTVGGIYCCLVSCASSYLDLFF